MPLVRPSEEHLQSHVEVLERSGSPNNERGLAATREELDRIALDAHAFLDSMDDREATGEAVTIPDGTTAHE